MNRSLPCQPLWTLLLLGLLLAGCAAGSAKLSFYSLYPSHPSIPAGVRLEQQGYSSQTLIMPVQLAPQLQHLGIVSRPSPATTRISPLSRWSGPLDEQFAGVIAANLKALLRSPHISIYPGPRYGRQRLMVEIRLDSFSPLRDQFNLEASWTISDVPSRRQLKQTSSSYTIPLSQPGYEGYAAAGSATAGLLSLEIAQALQTLGQP
ncbi:PqiC family protein [Desulfogranum mediterraneum]|uniref:PqiC family protein n=1 Tax=Desulfogranum mediterraneum TaxID=160661 RepID=UPI00040B17B2|nr:PqiC family protein [Desulfogranum mediterraneum]